MFRLEEYMEQLLGEGKKQVVLGAGSILKADDAAGVMVIESLIDHLGGDTFPRLKIIDGGTAPENFTGVIKKFKPDHILIIDAADFKEKPGTIGIVDPAIIGGVSFSTHMLPLKIMLEYLRHEVGCEVSIVGIQPADLTFGGEVSDEVKKAVDEFVNAFLQKFKKGN